VKGRIGERLLAGGMLDSSDIQKALDLQKKRGGRLGKILLDEGMVHGEDLYHELARQMGVEYLDNIPHKEIKLDLIKDLPIQFAKRFFLLPVEDKNGVVVVACADPLNFYALDDLGQLLGRQILPVLTAEDTVLEAINEVYDRAAESAERAMDGLNEEGLGALAQEFEEPEDLLDASDEAPIIRLVNSLCFQAVKERASDIHIEPFERDVSVRFRIDGDLREIIRPPKRFQNSIASRVKVMAGLNIAEKRLPQDGRIRIKIAGRDIDIRLSTIPVAHGERIVMRLLDKTSVIISLEDIGMEGDLLDRMNRLIKRSNGIVLVTGPTGSGKTTTLYAALTRIKRPDLNIITVEDPVEYQIADIGQIQVNPKINLTFANGLRSILRQDPDIIMVGEIRDVETADIAIQASLTGHLVLSTLHTNDAAGAITRLLDMGVEPFLVGSTLAATIAQRLVRVLCPNCRQPYRPTDAELAELGIARELLRAEGFYKPAGCEKCSGTGYYGRTGIFEMLVVDDEVRELIVERSDSVRIKKSAMSRGMRTLRDDGVLKIISGTTCVAEVLSVTQEDMF
jgi:general secretion pathway protein E